MGFSRRVSLWGDSLRILPEVGKEVILLRTKHEV